jgi:5-methylcytosine-specific restriction endonuclease McrA
VGYYVANVNFQSRRRVAKYEGVVTAKDWFQILKENQNKCVYCGRSKVKLTMDHVIPISKGGKHEPSNVLPACLSCNIRKGSKTMKEFIKSLKVLR